MTSGNLLVDPAGLTIAPDGLIYVVENVGTLGTPSVISVNPATGAQTLVTQGGQLCYPFGIAAEARRVAAGHELRRLQRRHTVINCVYDFGALIRIDTGTHAQSIVSRERCGVGQPVPQPARRDGRAGRAHPGGEPERRHGARGRRSRDGVQDAETPNTAHRPRGGAAAAGGHAGRRRGGERLHARRPGGRARVREPADGAQSILRQDKQLFNNPLGVAVVANRAPGGRAVGVAGGRGRAAPVSFDASGSSDPEGLAAPLRLGPRRQRQLRDRRRHDAPRSRSAYRARPRSPRACA